MTQRGSNERGIEAAISAIRSGQSTREEVDLGDPDGMEAVISTVPDELGTIVIELHTPDGDFATRTTMFSAARTSARSYPLGVPFVPGCTMSWTQLPDDESHYAYATESAAPELFDVLRDELLRSGWSPVPETIGFEGAIRESALSRSGRVRVLLLHGVEPRTLVTLLELPQTPPEGTEAR